MSKVYIPDQKLIPVQRQKRRFNIDIANSVAQERGGNSKCISIEYINIDTPMLWRCAKGHEWSTTLYRIKNMGRWCPQCAGHFPCGLMDSIKHIKSWCPY